MDKIRGTRPTVLFIDEHSSLKNVVENLLFRQMVTHGHAVLHTSFDPENNTFDSEVFSMPDMIMDDGSVVDFKTDFDPVVCGGGRYHHPQYDQIPRGTITGRIRKDNPQFQELPGVRELQAKAWGELLHKAFDSPQARAVFKEQTFLDRYSGHGLMPMKFKAAFEINSKAADHPSRKREPKGPRGKWGKL